MNTPLILLALLVGSSLTIAPAHGQGDRDGTPGERFVGSSMFPLPPVGGIHEADSTAAEF